MRKSKISVEERLNQIKQVDAYKAEGMKADEAIKKAGISHRSIYYHHKAALKKHKGPKVKMEVLSGAMPKRKYKKSVVIKPSFEELMLVMGNASEIAEFYKNIKQ